MGRPGTRYTRLRRGSGGMIEVRDVTKRYGDKMAVDHLSFSVEPGRVTGFLGPNGAGKSTTMRLVLGLDYPNAGSATINGKPYHELSRPLRTVGALLEAKSVHGGRSARNHLLFLAQTQGLPRRRVDEMLALVGLLEVADKRAGGFSLGMSQRLGIAAALLGDPGRAAAGQLGRARQRLPARAGRDADRPAASAARRQRPVGLAGVRGLLPLDRGTARHRRVPAAAPRRLDR